MHTPHQPVYRTLDEIQHPVQSLEDLSLAPHAFNHHAHMTVALWYLSHHPYAEAVQHTRTAIQRYAAHHGHTTLYNETITLFWLTLLRHVLDVAPPQTPLPHLVYHALRRFGSMRYAYCHYSRDRLFSEDACRQWIVPDLLPLPFGDPSSNPL